MVVCHRHTDSLMLLSSPVERWLPFDWLENASLQNPNSIDSQPFENALIAAASSRRELSELDSLSNRRRVVGPMPESDICADTSHW